MSEHRQSASGPAPLNEDLGVLLAACCERVVRTVLATLGPAGYGHLTPTQAISNICTVLQADGLLDRQPHTDDARSRRLALTADGHRLHDLLSQAGADA